MKLLLHLRCISLIFTNDRENLLNILIDNRRDPAICRNTRYFWRHCILSFTQRSNSHSKVNQSKSHVDEILHRLLMDLQHIMEPSSILKSRAVVCMNGLIVFIGVWKSEEGAKRTVQHIEYLEIRRIAKEQHIHFRNVHRCYSLKTGEITTKKNKGTGERMHRIQVLEGDVRVCDLQQFLEVGAILWWRE